MRSPANSIGTPHLPNLLSQYVTFVQCPYEGRNGQHYTTHSKHYLPIDPPAKNPQDLARMRLIERSAVRGDKMLKGILTLNYNDINDILCCQQGLQIIQYTSTLNNIVQRFTFCSFYPYDKKTCVYVCVFKIPQL